MSQSQSQILSTINQIDRDTVDGRIESKHDVFFKNVLCCHSSYSGVTKDHSNFMFVTIDVALVPTTQNKFDNCLR